MKKLMIAFCLLSLWLSACSAKPQAAASGETGVTSPGSGSSLSQSEGPSDSTHPRRRKGSGGSSSSTGGAGTGGTGTPSAGPTLRDTLYAVVNDMGDFGCHFRVGDSCKIPWLGNYYLISSATGNMVFAAYENGSKIPAKSVKAPVNKGYAPFQAKMDYRVGLGATTVRFHAWLENATGAILAESGSQSFDVTPPA